MFEIDEDVDVDDGFLNVVFENEEIHNNNKLLKTGKLNSTGISTELNIPSADRDCMKNPLNQSVTLDTFHARHDLCSSGRSTEDYCPEFSHRNNIHQPGSDTLGNKENKRKQVSPPPSRSKRERKFPGPAGLLPDRKSSRGTPQKFDLLPEVESPSASTPEELCSQGRLSGSVLEEEPWQNFLTDLGPHADVLDIVNVASVKRKGAARCFVGRKVPFLAAVLHHLDVSSADPCIILRDSTGEIHGTLHREVWQQFAAELVVGSVLVIRNVGLLSTGLSSRRHYLNITANNLATIYSANPDKAQKRELHSLTSQDFIRTIEDWRSLVAPMRTTGSPASSLFNTSLPSSSLSSPTQSPHLDGHRHPSIPHVSNMRPACQVRGNGVPQFPRALAPLRPMGKKLFPSLTNSNKPNSIPELSSNISNCRLLNASIPSCNVNKTNVNRNTLNNPQSTQITVSSHNNLFDPAISITETKGSAVYPPNNFEKLSTSRNKYRNDCENNLGNNSSRVILSQSSQLTVEEQSVVDNVFDGIDADSLFDDF